MPECHASECSALATMRLRFMTDFTFKDRPTDPLDYCEPHGNAMVEKWSARGVRVLVEESPMLIPDILLLVSDMVEFLLSKLPEGFRSDLTPDEATLFDRWAAFQRGAA